MNFQGSGVRIDDYDLPRLGAEIGVGEDEIHAVLDVEASGSGFDNQGRLKMLFEPHIFFHELQKPSVASGAVDRAARAGLAYRNWGQKPYPKDSYPRLLAAMEIDETAALRSCSWGLGQILGRNHALAGYPTVQEMVAAFCEDEANHLAAMVNFIKATHLDDELRRHDWAGFARGYNGAGYARNKYDVKLKAAFEKWRKIRDTPYPPPAPVPLPRPAPPALATQPTVKTWQWPWFKFW